MKKTNHTATFLYIAGLVLLGAAALFFAVAWYFRLVPLEPAWGNWGTWVGAVGTIAGFTVAIISLAHSEKMRLKADADERAKQSKRVGITSIVKYKPAPTQWRLHQEKWAEGIGDSCLPSMEEQEHLDSFPGPWIGEVTWTVQNGSPYPLFDAVVSGDHSKLPAKTPDPSLKTIRLPTLLAGSTTSGKWSVDLSSRPRDDMFPDLVELKFTDIWKDRWTSTSRGCDTVS